MAEAIVNLPAPAIRPLFPSDGPINFNDLRPDALGRVVAITDPDERAGPSGQAMTLCVEFGGGP
jgi:hypothetical protein